MNKQQALRSHKTISRILKENFYSKGDFYAELLENINEAVWAGDTDEITKYVNPAFLRLSGYTLEECKNRTCFDFFEDEDKEVIIRESAKRPYGIKSQYQINIKNKSGEKIPVLVSGAPIMQNNKWIGSIGVMADLREIIKKETHNKHLAAILESSIDAIVSLDVNRKILSWNHGAELLFKYTAEEMLGKDLLGIVPQKNLEEGEIDRMRAEVNLRGFIRNFQTTRIAKDGSLIPVSISQTAIRDDNRKIIGYSLLYRDISAQKKWEEELQARFDKMQAAYLEMGKQRRYLDYLSEILEIALGKQAYGDLTNYIVNAFMMISHVDAVTFRIYNKEKDRMELASVSSIGRDWWSKKYTDIKGTIFEKIFKTKKPLKILDIWSEPLYPSPGLARKYNLKSVLIIPLFFKNEKMGVVSLYINPDNSLDLFDNEFIVIFAKAVAVAMLLMKNK